MKIVIFHSFLYVYQRVTNWGIATIGNGAPWRPAAPGSLSSYDGRSAAGAPRTRGTASGAA